MMRSPVVSRTAVWTLSVTVAALLAACSSTHLAPVTDRGSAVGTAPAAMPTPAKVLPGAENAGKPGYYTVVQGDTLYKIARETGQRPATLQAWNNLENPNVIEVGQVLRVVPPAGVAHAPAPRPAPTPTPTPVAPAPAPVTAGSAPTPVTPPPSSSASAPTPAVTGEDAPAFIWPVPGKVIQGFDGSSNKGVDIAGKAGEPVLAAADGRVVYAGAGLSGYGNLVILKHNNTFLTAYAHNQSIHVKEDQAVKKGERIALMGSSDSDRVKLHFEVRRAGKPVDPLRYMPAR